MLVDHKFILIFAIIVNAELVFGLETDTANKEEEQELNSNDPSFRIVAPEFLCGDTQTEDSVPSPNEITISTQTKGGQKLTYRVQIYFVVLGKLKGQQHTLSIWKSVRQLQRKIANDKEDISLKNQISIHNSELTPGVQYTFEIVGVDEAGRESKSQNFTMTYREGKFGTEIQQDGTSVTEEVSLLLIGSETAYGDMPIIIEARSIWCTPNNDYYMKWDIKPAENRNGLLNYFSIKGKLLRIPSGILKAAKTYQISVELLRNEGDKVITKAEMKLTIMSREYSARILPEILLVGINKPIEINLILKDSDNTGNKFNIIWSCNLADDTACDDFIPSQSTTQTMQFYSRGNYTISVVVELDGVPKTVSSNIIVNPEVIAYPQILNLPTRAISANDNFELSAIINDLIPNCYAEWIVLKEAGFSYFNETRIPGGLGNITIHDVEEAFLSELVDYGNDTITRSIPLKIPKQNSEWNPPWPGLVPNSKYKFRLRIICPEPIDDSKSEERKNIESFTDVVIETNAPPIPLPMEVEPLAGESLRTIFKFTTGVAKDRSSDYPLKYGFYYVIDGFVINLGEFYETMVTTTDLPYSKSGIQTYYQVCDSRDACSNDVPGPNITITLVENVTDAELEFKKSFVQRNMETMNLESSFNTAIACLLTYQHFADKKYFNEIQMTIIEAIKSTIAKIKNQEVFIFSNDEILYFIKLSKKILDVIDYKEKDIYKGLLELLDNIDVYSAANESDPSKSRMVDLFDDIRRRVKRSDKNFANQRVNQKDKNRDKIITALDLYEKVVDDDGLTDFVKRVEQEIRSFCKVINDQHPLVYVKEYVAFEAIKTYDPELFQDHSLVIPFEKYSGKSSKFKFNKKMQFPLDGNYCYAKIFYPKRNNVNLAENDDVYEFMLFQNGDEKKFRPTQQKMEKNFIYEIPIINVDNSNTLKCAIRTEVIAEWDHGNCETTEVTESFVKCQCLNFGLFKVIETDLKETTTTTISSAVPVANEIDDKTTIATNDPVITTAIVTTTIQNQQSTTTLLPTTITESTQVHQITSTGSNVSGVDDVTTSTVSSAPTMTTLDDEHITETTTTSAPGTSTLVGITTSTTTNIPETTTLLLTTAITTVPNLPETTTLLLANTNRSDFYTFKPIPNETDTIVVTSTVSNPEITTNSEVNRNTTLINYSNSATTAVYNVEIINQTTNQLQVKDELTTVVTKGGNTIAIDDQTTDEKDNNQSTKINQTTDTINNANNSININTGNESTGAKIIINSTDSDASSDRNTVASIGITAALSFVIFCGFFGIIVGVLYNKRKRKATIQEIEISTSSIREPSQGLRYARFYDAKNMGGNLEFDESPTR